MISPKDYKRRPLAVAMSLTCGKQNEAMLLSEVWDFFIRSKATANGKKVVVQTDEQLCYRTGLSFDQTRRAKRRLILWGYFQAWQAASYQYHQGLIVTHIHLPEQVVKLMNDLLTGTAQICTTGIEQNCIAQIVQGCPLPLYIEEVSKNKAKQPPGFSILIDEQKQLDELKEIV